ncbi:hypothetical protein O1Q96_19550 [Streptomyces sp. Qhu-G9]|uniref:hypothetical protein n=1 Tax=Streptomyces sp. Qhu-G9 TaxID=3452799 RepID=UPI0022AC89F2|nr:hypothetical protein [Streptomyces aurantiacus]WAU81782.1 hypothetical protein O1Q96_19550 [Streptomyces aurantiacus]
MGGGIAANAAVAARALLVHICRRATRRRPRLPCRDPLAPLVKTARSLNYGGGEFLGPDDRDR